MKEVRKVFIYGSDTESTEALLPGLYNGLEKAGIGICESPAGCDMVVAVGGDGTFLRLFRDHDISNLPVAGINTGHLGFFMEYSPDELNAFILDIRSGNYSIHHHRTIGAEVRSSDGRVDYYKGINEIVIRKNASNIVHLNLSIGSSFIERFSGDGLLVSTPAGSTSYNYSVGGGIIDPRVSVLQVSPIAPMNTTSYRSFTSGVVLPADMSVLVEPEHKGSSAVVIVDGVENWYEGLDSVTINLLNEKVNVVRKPGYDYWSWVAEKFI